MKPALISWLGVTMYLDEAARLAALGFSHSNTWTPDELNRRYLANRADGLHIGAAPAATARSTEAAGSSTIRGYQNMKERAGACAGSSSRSG
ncbi:hypothetical protein E2P84_10550 [Burkholderia cepacia]|uniref:Uncharacterized protein n=1 Tax=Burkholderia cepacia TaxID=292 RepID=A0AAX2RPK7_BURCE|nr:hypothetical protein [Burkholderia cepacia]TES79111.1 hypothetical protein E2P84_10550 [Burkholderia cepacia]TET01160.1 hypothetical protein E3D36_18680 [Burkholderia cepacia]TEU46172.1 hypothetical protein E3D37_18350 [Burkholderia cepacia]TEU47748.1 hypothetical protein E3D39_04720 [Burkholderia cepacia]TEU51245.1 hypothetical protein E3D38_17010 [Burkholderia cepacia]